MISKNLLLLGFVTGLAACGGGNAIDRADRRVQPVTKVAFGPISKACLQSDRSERSRQLCGCIQAVADRTLSHAEQRRSVSFYRDPHLAQTIRQSNRPQDERFWDAYTTYGEQAERLCG